MAQLGRAPGSGLLLECFRRFSTFQRIALVNRRTAVFHRQIHVQITLSHVISRFLTTRYAVSYGSAHGLLSLRDLECNRRAQRPAIALESFSVAGRLKKSLNTLRRFYEASSLRRFHRELWRDGTEAGRRRTNANASRARVRVLRLHAPTLTTCNRGEGMTKIRFYVQYEVPALLR